MASSSAWCSVLKNLPVFQKLKHFSEHKNPGETKHIFVYFNGDVYLWDSEEQNVFTINLKKIEGKNIKTTDYQVLLCTTPPLFEVDNLSINGTGFYLALSGAKGISILDLPQGWGKSKNYESDSDKITCRTTPVAERFFICSKNLRLLQICWHPGSTTDSHLVLLTSDNFLRIYNVVDLQLPEQQIQLGEHPNSFSLSPAKASFSQSLGEAAVSFDFGLSFEKKQSKLFYSEANEEVSEIVWPIYLLMGNGDVHLLLNSLQNKNLKEKVEGPLTMHPAAEDNYGADACSILCLQCIPPVLVIATCSGTLYHCVVLENFDDEDSESISWLKSKQSTSSFDIPDAKLFVYESVALELSLSIVSVSTGEVIHDDYSCPISLHRDPENCIRYFCCHKAGIHMVVLPWLKQMENYCNSAESEICNLLKQDLECYVEHLLCTRPLPNSDAVPIYGLCMFHHYFMGSILLAMTCNYDILTVYLPPVSEILLPSLANHSNVETITSPLKIRNQGLFDDHIKKFLQRSITHPLLKAKASQDYPQQDLFQLLNRATQIFREEYLQKQDLAREELERRAKVLRVQKEQHLIELKNCHEARIVLRDEAEDLALKYEDILEKQHALLARIEKVVRKIQCRIPIFSDAERNMKKELQTLEERLKHFKNTLEQIKMKQKYQQKISLEGQKSLPLSGNHMKHVKDIIQEEGHQMIELIKKVKSLKMDLIL